MVCLTKHNMVLPLRGGFCESSQIAMASSAHRMVGRFIPWASSSPWALPMANRLMPFQGVNGWCAPKGQTSSSPMATPWAMETSPSTSITAPPVSATNEKCIIAPKGHKHQEYGTIAL